MVHTVHWSGAGAGYGTRVGIAGWVYQVGNTGYPASQGPIPARSQIPAKRAPEGPAGAWSGWVSGTVPIGPVSAPAQSLPTPAGPGRPAGLPGRGLGSPGNKGEIP